MAKKNIIIIGSGITGLLASHLLKSKYNTYIIENTKNIGGLLSSIKFKNMYFDYGTHIAFKINHKELDKILFDKLNKKDWNIFKKSVKEGIYNFGKLDKSSGTLDGRNLSKKLISKAQNEILLKKKKRNFNNLSERLLSQYGKTLTNNIYKKAVKKISSQNLENITPDFLENFSIERIRLFDDEKILKLKRNSTYNSKLAFNQISDRLSPYEKYYHKKGGSINWLKQIIDKKKINLNTYVKDIEIKNKKIINIKLSNNRIIKCEKLIWSAPPISFLKIINKKFLSEKPNFRNLLIVHLEINEKINHDLQYVTCYDNNFKIYRVTFYSNLRNIIQKRPFNLSCEIITDDVSFNQKKIIKNTFKELKYMNLIPSKSKILNSLISFKRGAVVIHSPKSYLSFRNQIKQCKKLAKNILFLGRNNFKHSLYQNLVDTYNQCLKLLN